MSKEKLLEEALRLYAGDHILQGVLEDGNRAFIPKMEQKDLTIFYLDVNPFTTNKQLTPNDLLNILNNYFEMMTKSIHKNNGIVEQYYEDSIIAIFGLNNSKSQILDACKAALTCTAMCEKINIKFSMPNLLSVSIGINTGKVFIGTLGSNQRLVYTTKGDTKKFTSRLESMNQHYNTQILISSTTKNGLDNSFKIREVDKINVKGRSEPKSIFELLAMLV